MNGFSLNIKEHEEEILKLIKDKFLNEDDEISIKDMSNFIFNILLILGDNLEDKDKKL